MTEEKNWVNLPFYPADMRPWIDICNECPLACAMPVTHVPFEIVGDSHKPDVLFIAEAPFKDEMKQQRPLIGKSGAFLRDVLDQYLTSYALANVVSCHPTNTTKGPRSPEENEQEYCVEHVQQFIELIEPKLIVMLGKIAYSNVLPKQYLESLGKDAEYVGKMQKKGAITSEGITYACSYHPSYIVRNGGIKSNSYISFNTRIKQVLRAISSETDTGIDVPSIEDKVDMQFVRVRDIPWVLRELEPYRDIGLDYEGRTLDPWFIENKPTGFSLSAVTGPHTGISYYIMIDGKWDGEVFVDNLENFPYERDLLLDFFKRKFPWTYNAKYETNMTWASLGERVKFNDSFSLCKIDCSPTSLKLNAQKMLGADLWEEEVSNIVSYYEFIFGQMKRQGEVYPEIVDLLKRGSLLEACALIHADEKIVKKFAKLLSSADALQELITLDDFRWGLTKYPYQWAAVPTEILGTYCCWDSYLTIQLKNALWPKYAKFYQYYITQTWLAGNMESFGYNWNDKQADEHNYYYVEEATQCLYNLINVIDTTDEDRMDAQLIWGNPDPDITPTDRLKQLKTVFNPLSNAPEKQDIFWRAYRTPFTETIAFFKYLHQEVGQNDVLEDDTFLPMIKAGRAPHEVITEMEEACGASRRKHTALDKILSRMESNLNFYFRRFAIEITKFHYDAHTQFGGVDIDDKNTWNDQFYMMYQLKRFKKVLKVDSTYIWGKTGRVNVFLAEMEDRNKPPRRIANWYDVPRTHVLEPNQRWILNPDYFECGADTKRWRAGIHTVPSSSELREIYEPRTPTSIMLHADYAQNEVRFLAKMAEEQNLMRAFEAGVDVHKFVASNIFKKPEEDVTSTERSYAKAATFGLLYGKTVSSFATEMMGGDLAGATKFFAEFFAAFPGIKEFVDKQHAQVLEHGFVYTLFGDPININTDFYREDEVLRRAQNYPIQSSASSLGAHAIYLLNEAVDKHSLRASPLGFCHDACDWDLEVEDLFKFMPLMHANMVDYIKDRFGIPVGIDWELGVNQNFMMKLEPEEDGFKYKFECPKASLEPIVARLGTHFVVNYEIHKEKDKYHSMKDLFAPKGAFSKFFGETITECEGVMHFSEKAA